MAFCMSAGVGALGSAMRGLRLGGRPTPSGAVGRAPAAAKPLGFARGSTLAGKSLSCSAVDTACLGASTAHREVTESKYKLKTRKAAAKRFKVTAGGKVMHRSPNKGHMLAKKSQNRKNRLSLKTPLKDGDVQTAKKMLPHADIRN